MATRTITNHVGSLSALLTFAERDATPRAGEFREMTEPRTSCEWVGVPDGTTWADLRRLFATGDPAAITRLRDEIGRIQVPPVKTVRRRGAWSDQGDELSRDRLYAGYGDSWRTARRQAVAGVTHVRLVAEIGAHSKMNASRLFYSGAATVAIAEALSTAGYEVEILAGCRVANVDNMATVSEVTTVVVKPYEAPLNLAPLLAATASSPFYRTAMFGVRCNLLADHGLVTATGMGAGNTPIEEADLPTAPPHVRTILVRRALSAEEANDEVARALGDLAGTPVPPRPRPTSPKRPTPPARRGGKRYTPSGVTRSPGAPPSGVPVDEQEGRGSAPAGLHVYHAGRQWAVEYVGPTKYGPKAKLVDAQGRTTWVAQDEYEKLPRA